jgi:hypothetical protein
MAEFYFPPEWADAPEPPPPPVDADRIEGLANRFIAASQDALHTAPDALFGKTGANAVDGAPAAVAQLSGLRDATLDLARDEPERQALADRLDRYHSVALDDIDRHVAEQRQVAARQTIADRQALNLRAAGLEHNEDVLPGLAGAHAQVARALARLDGMPEEPAMQAARSAVWRGAIDQRLADGEGARALSLFERARDTLVPADQHALEVPMEAARTDIATDQWIERQAGKDGESLATRLQADTDLSPAEKATALAKIEARDSAQESARVAAVKGLDDRLGATAGTLATQPAAYRPGTLAAIANAYDDAGESDKADSARRMALQESFLRSFATSSAAAQQRLIDSLPDGEGRAAAEAIQARQNEAFTKDAFTAGTALYPDVGPPAPIGNLTDRIAQARTIAAYREVPVAPFTTDEITALRRKLADGTPQERKTLLAQLSALPADIKQTVDATGPVVATDRPSSPGITLARYEPSGPPLAPGGDGPIKLPPHNDPSSEEWTGHIVTLPDGTLIEDPSTDRRNYTGYVMAPADNLKEVAATGRRDGEQYRSLRDNPLTAEDAEGVKALMLFSNVGTGGRFDTQREGNQLLGLIRSDFIHHRQFRPIANINVGLYGQQFGLTLDETLALAGTWARLASSNTAPDQPHNLDPWTTFFIKKGYEIGQKGLFDSK